MSESQTFSSGVKNEHVKSKSHSYSIVHMHWSLFCFVLLWWTTGLFWSKYFQTFVSVLLIVLSSIYFCVFEFHSPVFSWRLVPGNLYKWSSGCQRSAVSISKIVEKSPTINTALTYWTRAVFWMQFVDGKSCDIAPWRMFGCSEFLISIKLILNLAQCMIA